MLLLLLLLFLLLFASLATERSYQSNLRVIRLGLMHEVAQLMFCLWITLPLSFNVGCTDVDEDFCSAALFVRRYGRLEFHRVFELDDESPDMMQDIECFCWYIVLFSSPHTYKLGFMTGKPLNGASLSLLSRMFATSGSSLRTPWKTKKRLSIIP